MGSVAAAMKRRGFDVTGSDEKVYPPMSTQLEQLGIALRQGYLAANPQTQAEIDAIRGPAFDLRNRCNIPDASIHLGVL